MIRVSGPGGPPAPRTASGARSGDSPFRVADAGTSAAAAPAAEAASASALGALIALQSDTGSAKRNRAAAERALMLLGRLRDGLLSGRVPVSDLAGLADAATAKLDEAEPGIAAIYAEIALRARVELAKLGR